ncbi:AlpA family phage regulatory protein, partial [Citrobacter freundii]|nr:AlpA family phage regulatory protein [Citrobacter freundii]
IVGAGHFYSLIKKGDFPAPIKLGRNSRWLMADYSEWKVRHIQKRDIKRQLK